MKGAWWKITGVLLVLSSVIAGLLLPVPARHILNESIRNLYFHVPMWFAMILIMSISFVYSIMYLRSQSSRHDFIASSMAEVGILIGILGCVTGMLWARFTWGAWWPEDPKLKGAASGMLIYLAYFVLRGALNEPLQRGKISAVYSIFAYPMFIVLIAVLPRMNDSLHPGNGGNPGFNMYDLDNTMRPVFYAAVIGWMLVSIWIATLKVRMKIIQQHTDEELTSPSEPL